MLSDTIKKHLDELTGGDEKQIERFLNEPRPEWLGLTPNSMISAGKMNVVEEFLDRVLNGEVLGY